MIVVYGNRYTRIDKSTERELKIVKQFLSNVDDSGIYKSFLTHDKKYPSGLTPLLEKECDLSIVVKNEKPKKSIRDIKVNENVLEDRTLRDYQVSSIRKALYFDRGILELATGAGKTTVMAGLIKYKPGKTLVLVPTGFLMEQHYEAFKSFGLKSVGRAGFGYSETDKDIVIAVVNSAYKAINKDHCPWVTDVDNIFLDEAHHGKSNMWYEICNACNASCRFAFTATAFEDPIKLSFEDLALIGQTGPVVFQIRSKQLRQRGLLADPHVLIIHPSSKILPINKYNQWNSVYKYGVVADKKRNNAIGNIANACYEGYYKSLIFCAQYKHGDTLGKLISQFHGNECILVQGSSKVSIYKPSGTIQRNSWTIGNVSDYINSNDRAIVCATTVLDEGIDIPVVNVLVMAAGMKKYRRSVQRIGRGMRPKDGDNKVYVFDFWDDHHPFLFSQSKYRKWTYEREEFESVDSIEHINELMGIDLSLDDE